MNPTPSRQTTGPEHLCLFCLGLTDQLTDMEVDGARRGTASPEGIAIVLTRLPKPIVCVRSDHSESPTISVSTQPSESQIAFLRANWELMSRKGGFFEELVDRYPEAKMSIVQNGSVFTVSYVDFKAFQLDYFIPERVGWTIADWPAPGSDHVTVRISRPRHYLPGSNLLTL